MCCAVPRLLPCLSTSANCPYPLLLPPNGRFRTCFYINKASPVSSWSHTQSKLTPDYCQVTIRLITGKLTIHNLYSATPPTPTRTERNSPIPDMLWNIMLQGGEHLFVGDFNLHHQQWGGMGVTRSDARPFRNRQALLRPFDCTLYYGGPHEDPL